jgi:16S rRNA (cytidine1402-2'-O)-methyltransferase
VSGAGTLYLVATPIGNLEDLTPRAARVLREVDAVACEDTRRTKGLLAHLGIHTKAISLHGHNERARIPLIVAMLREGKDVAVVTDAGTPAISDPGAALVAEVVREGLHVVPVPGPSAVTAAVALADFPADRFVFVGFLPRRRSERKRMLDALAALPMALVIFEAPHRIREALADLEECLGQRRMVLGRELTKLHEQVIRGTVGQVRAALDQKPRGEVTLVVAGAGGGAVDQARVTRICDGASAGRPDDLLTELLARGLSRRDAAQALAAVFRMPEREAYRMAAGKARPAAEHS